MASILALSACADAKAGEGGGLEHELDHMAATIMNHERLIADCMAGRGWTYIPALPASAVLEREQLLADAHGRPFDPTSVDVPADPNDAIVARLSAAERSARSRAYWGDLDAGGTDQGCYRATYERAWGRYPLPDPRIVADLNAALEADPRIVAAGGRYAGCMAAKGYQVAGPTDYLRIYLMRQEELGNRLRAQGTDPGSAPEMLAFLAEKAAADTANDECAKDYRAVEAQVRLDLLKRYGIR